MKHQRKIHGSILRYGNQEMFEAEMRTLADELNENGTGCAVDPMTSMSKDVLEKHRAEVVDMFLTKFDKKMYEEAIREEGRDEVREKYAKLSKDHAELSKDHAELSKDHAELIKQLDAERKKNAELEALLKKKN